ncbi:MAG: hypothetical protein GF398_21010 [Chitinivibrionales bacterium]|nr:hypothetical protein [Chitinivibrionales bacterium]
MYRVNDNPPARFPQRPLQEAEGVWWVAKLKPRQEKLMAFDLIENETEFYLPLYTKTIRRRDNNKPRKTVLPLFPGYICFCCRKGLEHSLYGTRRVVNLVPVRHQKRFIEEMGQIYRSLEQGAPLEPLYQFFEGDEVRVVSGPLRGIHGVIIKAQNNHKLVLSVEGLGRAAMYVDAATVKPVRQSVLVGDPTLL